MAPRSKIAQMPADVREWLDQALADRNFSGYKELESLLKERGFDISHAAIHRHGQQLEKRLARIKASTQAAELIAKAAPDDKDSRSEAVTAMIQTSIFDALMDLEDAESLPAEKRLPLLSKAAQGFAKLADSSLNRKKWQADVMAKIEAMAKAKSKKGQPFIQQEALDYIKEVVYGIRS